MRIASNPSRSAQMTSRLWLSAAMAFAIASTAACAGKSRPQTQAAAPPQAPAPVRAEAPAPQPPSDPVTTLIATSQRHFDAGERELKLGHLDRARREFDRAVDVM